MKRTREDRIDAKIARKRLREIAQEPERLVDVAEVVRQRDDLLLLLWACERALRVKDDGRGYVQRMGVRVTGYGVNRIHSFTVRWKDGYPTITPKTRKLLQQEMVR